jgi:hypothetical protein
MFTGEYSFAAEFETGMELILDGLERHLATDETTEQQT